ncbi:MAG: hypothetical protein WBK46_01420 [Ruminococcus flavefaciens]
MKNTKQIAETVLRIRDAEQEKLMIRNRRIKRAATGASSALLFCAVILAVRNLNASKDIIPPIDHDTVGIMTIVSDTEIAETTQSDIATTTVTGRHTKAATSYNSKNSETTTASSSVAESGNQSIAAQKTDAAITDYSVQSTAHSVSGTSAEIPSQTSALISETVTTSSNVQTTINEIRTEIVTRTESSQEVIWNEKTLAERFPKFEYNGKTYSLTVQTVADDNIDGKLGEVTLTGFDNSTNTYHTINGDVFKIKNISDNCNSALKFEGSDIYYIYFNRDYFPQTLGEFMDDTDIGNTLSLNNMYIKGSSAISENASEVLLTLFNSCREVQNTDDYSHHKNIVSFSANIPILGVNNKSIALTDDGYLITNIMEYGYSFYIGEEKVNEFCKQIGISET